MSELPDEGSFHFWLRPPAENWDSNDKFYHFGPDVPVDISINCAKHPDRKFEIRTSGIQSRAWRFIVDMPTCDERGLHVMLKWDLEQVTLFLNDEEVASKPVDSPYLQQVCQPFASMADSEKRYLATAIAFDDSSRLLFKNLVDDMRIFETLPTMMVPPIVCEAFAMELYLKALHYMDHNAPKSGHPLEEIYRELLPDTQDRIVELYEVALSKRGLSQEDKPFNDVLKQCSEAFVKWRYIHEPATSDQVFVGGPLRDAIRSAAQERCPDLFEDL